MNDNFLVDLATQPEGRNGIRTAVESYRHFISAFKDGLSGVLRGRSVTYSYHSHQFHSAKKTTMPTENVMISWEKIETKLIFDIIDKSRFFFPREKDAKDGQKILVG